MKKTLVAVIGLLAVVQVQAQTLQTSFLSDGYSYSYRLNPAIHPEFGFVGLPVVGYTSGSYKGDFSLRDVFYKVGGENVTFMNDAVLSPDFLDSFRPGMNKFSTESYSNLLAVGFKTHGLYNVVDLNFRNYNSAILPYDFMKFLKEGATAENGNYDLSGLRAHSTTFFEIGITSSWKVTRKLTVGMRFKGVIGFNNSYIDLDRMTISKSGNEWSVTSSGVIASAYDGYDIAGTPAYYDPSVELIDFQRTKVGSPRGLMNGYGVGADMGVLYDDSSWQLSASISDIGCVFWFHNLYGNAPSSAKTYHKTYQPHHHRGSTLDNEFSDMGSLIGDALNFLKEDEYQSLELLPLTVRLGVKYLYLSDISFGGLATFRYNDICPYWDIRGMVNYKPLKKVELIGSLGAGSLGLSVGAFANARLGFLNIFAGTDNLIGTSGSAFLPSTNGSPNFVAGLNIIW